MSNLIVGLGCLAQIGKDFAAIGLREYYDVERISFADKLKEDLGVLFSIRGLDLAVMLQDPKLKEEIRPLLVSYGQTLRKFDSDVWVKAALANREFPHELTVITDVRFPNEVEAIHKLGGVYIDILTNKEPANATEAAMAPLMRELADYTIVNNFDSSYIPNMASLIDSIFKKKITEVTNSV